MPKCIMCGKEHREDDFTYVSVQGNIYVGDKGGVVGNNFPLEQETFAINEVKRSVFCWPCLFKVLFQARDRIKEGLSRQIKELEEKRKALTRKDNDVDCNQVFSLNNDTNEGIISL